jgi:hypothetical protein
VDLADFVAFHDCLGDPRRRPGADHNGDGVVDLSDYAAWDAWIRTHESATTQEVFNYARVLMLEIFGIETPF